VQWGCKGQPTVDPSGSYQWPWWQPVCWRFQPCTAHHSRRKCLHSAAAEVISNVSSIIIRIIISIQPLGQFWQEPEPSQATGMALACCILGKFLRVVCHCFPLPVDVPTFAAGCLHISINVSAPSSERWNCGWEWCPVIFPKWRLFTPFKDLLRAGNLWHGTDGFTSTPKEGMLRIFSPKKSNGFGQVWTRNLGYQRTAC
jgi:hypothetical protein